MQGRAAQGRRLAPVVAGVVRRGDDEPGAALDAIRCPSSSRACPSTPRRCRRSRRSRRHPPPRLGRSSSGCRRRHRWCCTRCRGRRFGDRRTEWPTGPPTTDRRDAERQDGGHRHDGGGTTEGGHGPGDVHPPRRARQPTCCRLARVRSKVASRTRSGSRAGAVCSSHPLIGSSNRSFVCSSRRPLLGVHRLSRVGFERRTHRFGRVVQS